jgi:hypothetical protein
MFINSRNGSQGRAKGGTAAPFGSPRASFHEGVTFWTQLPICRRCADFPCELFCTCPPSLHSCEAKPPPVPHGRHGARLHNLRSVLEVCMLCSLLNSSLCCCLSVSGPRSCPKALESFGWPHRFLLLPAACLRALQGPPAPGLSILQAAGGRVVREAMRAPGSIALAV